MNKYKFGVVPSPEDKRDYKITSTIPKLNTFPNEFVLAFDGKVKDQGEVGSCVAFSLSYIKEYQEKKQSLIYKEFSTGFIYANRQEQDLQEEGMIPRQALNALKRYGNVLYDKFPFNIEYPEVRSKLVPEYKQLLKDAEPFQITSYFKLKNKSEMKSNIINNGPVTACFPIWENIYSINDKNFTLGLPPEEGEEDKTFLGYHQMTIMGWKENGDLIILNSWGEKFGDKGYLLIPKGYPIVEMWGLTDEILPREDLENPKFYSIIINKVFRIKASAEIFIKSLKIKGFKNLYINHVEEEDTYQVQVGFYSNPQSNNLYNDKVVLDKLEIPCKLVYK